jgi:hypothetical protein
MGNGGRTMEILIYGLLILLSAVELFVSMFILENHTLLPFTAVGLALALLVCLIRIYYVEKRLKLLAGKDV